MLHKASNSKEETPYCFPRSSIKYQSHTGQNITDFDPNWAFPNYRLVAAFKSLRFALFSRSYIKFQGHTGWKIDDLDQIWARLLGRLQLSNPSDLPCHICWLLSCPYLYISRGYLSCSYDDDKILFHENMSISYLLIPCFLILPSGARFTSMDLHNTLSPRQNGRHFPDNFKCIFLNGNVWITIKISLKFVPEGPINNIPALVQIMAWRRPGQFTDAYMRHPASMS